MYFLSGSMFKIFRHILLGLLLGVVVALMYLSSSLTFKQYIADSIQKQFEQDYDCHMKVTVESLDLLTCCMTLTGITISPKSVSSDLENKQDSWSIVAEKLTVQGSWLSLLLHKKLKVCLYVQRMMMLETFDQVPEKLAKFCGQMFRLSPDAMIVYDLVSISDGLIFFKRSDGLSIQLPYVCNLRAEKKITRVQWYVQSGVVADLQSTLVRNISGSVLADFSFATGLGDESGLLQINYDLCKKDGDVAGFCVGKFKDGLAEFSIKTEDGSVIIDPIKMKYGADSCLCDVRIDATSEVLQHFDLPDFLHEISGVVGLSFSCDLCRFAETLQAAIVFQNITYKSKLIMSNAKLIIADHSAEGLSGTLIINDEQQLKIVIQNDESGKKCKIQNVADIYLPFNQSYKIIKDQTTLTILYHDLNSITGDFSIDIFDQVLCETHRIMGNFSLKDSEFKFFGSYNDIDFEGIVQLFPEYSFKSFIAKRKGDLLIEVSSDPVDSTYVIGSVDFSLIKDLVSDPFKMSFSQEGSFVFRGYLKDGICGATVQTHYAHIRVPYLYNVIQNVSATCQLYFYDKKIVFKDVDIELYEGKISCSFAHLYFDKNLLWNFCHAPLLLHDVMLSWNKGVYGRVSGRILLQKLQQDQPFDIDGQLMVQKAELKENIFSPEFQDLLTTFNTPSTTQSIFNPRLKIDLFTKDLLQIDTSFLSAQAVMNVQVTGPLQKTQTSGSLKLLSGVLNFPYKPLDIVEGRLQFVPEQPFDPIIEFVAKGKIKRYHIVLKAWGSALDPHVKFESDPYLSEEQIISLLLLGIQDQSLSLMVPAFLSQRLKDVIFGPALSNVKLKSVFDVLLQSLKYIRFIPQFTNQTGRGGVRGIFEIDASDRLQAKIDTDFAQLEDTKFDVDYAATDDVTFRLQKDGPSTYGGQVEFAWKFS